MTDKNSVAGLASFREKKQDYVAQLHAELGLTRRFHVGFFAAEFFVNVSALHAAYPSRSRRRHLSKYFERAQATLETSLGAGHWKLACYAALRRDYLTGALDWVIAEYQKERVR